MPRFTWPQAVIVIAALAAVVTLAMAHIDTTAIISLIIMLLLGGTLSAVSHVKEQTNGNMTKFLETVQRQSDQLARAYPVAVQDDTPTPDIADGPPTR